MPEIISPLKNFMPQRFMDAISAKFPQRLFAAVILEIPATKKLSQRKCPGKWLNRHELTRFQSFTSARRRNEWLAGRICAKTCISSCGTITQLLPSAIGIESRPDGRPYCVFPPGWRYPQSLDISITHSDTFAAALASDRLCGIDIQHCRESLLRVQNRYCSGSEEALLRRKFPSSAWLNTLNLLWTAKEAVRKTLSYHDLPGFLELDLCEVQHPGSGCYYFNFSYINKKTTAVCTHLDDYSLAACSVEVEIHA